LDPITFFEITSAGFFKLAAEHSSDYTLLETGLGGRLDSSNVMTPLISVIASISHDHHDFLGDTIEKIAAEKAGIIKKNIPVIIGYQPFNEARRVLLEYAESIEAPTFMYDQDYTMSKDGDHLVYEDEKHKIRFENLSHQGEFQIKNLGLAIATCFQLKNINVHSFLENNLHQKVYFPGRFEKLKNNTLNKLISEQNELYLDGSHNPDAAANINEALRSLTEKKLCIVIGMLNTKNPAEYIQQFSDIESIHTISIPGEENTLDSLTLKDMVYDQCQNTYASENIESAIKDIVSKNPDARILICGSLYLAGQVLKDN
jgi:dihydrofolate synthase/folylpolyglutamate synthase